MSSDKLNDGRLPVSPLLRLPLEVRLIIYEYLLLPSMQPSTGSGISVANLLPDFHTYYSEDTNSDAFTLSVRTIDPWLGGGSKSWRRRSTYYVRTGPFLTSSSPTTYRVLLSPYTAHLRHTVPSLLALNHQIHAEASRILYSTYKFSFHTTIEALVPFLTDLTPIARQNIRHIRLTKKALPYTKEFDRAEWENACAFLAHMSASSGSSASILSGNAAQSRHDHHHHHQQHNGPLHSNLPLKNQLHTLHLDVIAGKPDLGWDQISSITPADYATILHVKREWGGGGGGSDGAGSIGDVDLEWVEQLMAIKGLREVSVRALMERCPQPVSEKMAFWVAFSKSVVEGGFGEWVKESMIGKA